VSVRKFDNRLRVRLGALLAAGLTATTMSLVPATVGLAAPQSSVLTAAAVVATNKATDVQKIKAAAALAINPDETMLLFNDQQFVFEMWRQAKEKSFVKAEALRAYASEDADAAYTFITAGIFTAANDDAQVEIADQQAKALRRSVLVIVGLDPADTAMIEKDDYQFIVAVWEKAEKNSYVQAAALAAFADGTDQSDWTEFLTTGAKAAAKRDLEKKIEDASEAEAARLRAEELARAKRSLLQLLLLPVTQEVIDAPNRQYVLHVYGKAKGAEVKIAAQVALNAPDADLAQALSDFIFTGGAAANTRDENAAAAKELADYRVRVTAIRDEAKQDRYAIRLLAAANAALATDTLVALQVFLLSGQDAARKLDEDAMPDALHRGVRFGSVTGVSNKCIDIVNSGTANGTRVQLLDCRTVGAQDVTVPGDGTMRVLGRCLDAGGPATGSTGDRFVHLWTCNGTPPQQWEQRKNGALYQPTTERCLDAPTSNNGAQLYLHTCHGGDNQKWNIPALAAARFGKVVGPASKCIDIPNGRNANGTAVTLYTCNDSYAQHVTVPGDDTLRLAGKCVDAGGPEGTGAGERLVHLWTCNGTPAQKWRHHSDGTLYNELTKFCLDTPNTNNAAQLYVHSCNGGTNQRWKLPQAS
jgi:hypothetical protein